MLGMHTTAPVHGRLSLLCCTGASSLLASTALNTRDTPNEPVMEAEVGVTLLVSVNTSSKNPVVAPSNNIVCSREWTLCAAI